MAGRQVPGYGGACRIAAINWEGIPDDEFEMYKRRLEINDQENFRAG